MKRDPNRQTGVRFSEQDAARARQEVERQHESERRCQALWIRFKRRREREAASVAGAGIERAERRAA